jgi:hypothetical protein
MVDLTIPEFLRREKTSRRELSEEVVTRRQTSRDAKEMRRLQEKYRKLRAKRRKQMDQKRRTLAKKRSF